MVFVEEFKNTLQIQKLNRIQCQVKVDAVLNGHGSIIGEIVHRALRSALSALIALVVSPLVRAVEA